MKFLSFMPQALEQAKAAAKRGEVPVGAVIVDSKGQIIAAEGNRTRELNDPTAHAEMLVIRQACTILKQERLQDCALYVTLEPCAMCAGAISHARIGRLYYGASDEKSGGIENGARVFSHAQCHHVPQVYEGLDAQRSSAMLKAFFTDRRR